MRSVQKLDTQNQNILLNAFARLLVLLPRNTERYILPARWLLIIPGIPAAYICSVIFENIQHQPGHILVYHKKLHKQRHGKESKKRL